MPYKPVAPDEVIDACCRVVGVEVDRFMCHKYRTEKLILARTIAVKLIRDLCDYSYPETARAVGYRSQSSAMDAYKRAGRIMRADPALMAMVAVVHQDLSEKEQLR